MTLQTFIFKVKRRINNFYMKYYFKRNFVNFYNNSTKREFKTLLNFDYFKANFVYKDDSWILIKNLAEYLDFIFQNKKYLYDENYIDKKRYSIKKNSISVKSFSHDNNWICMYLDLPNYSNYEIEYDVIPYSSLQEIQIAFNYKDLGNRLRFMVHNDKEVVFEAVYRGVFYHNLRSVNYKIKKGKKYKIKLRVSDNVYSYFINDELILSVKDRRKLIKGDKVCLIFYNQYSNDDVCFDLLNFKFNILEK